MWRAVFAAALIWAVPCAPLGTQPGSRTWSTVPPKPLSAPPPPPPAVEGPSLEDEWWEWKGQRIRFQRAVPEDEHTAPASAILIHGFGGNCDHWRRNTPCLAEAGMRTFSVDLLGYGFSAKPSPSSHPPGVNGEARRDLDSYQRFAPPGAKRIGGVGETPFTDMAHPTGSFYNFYTWADQLADFAEEVVADDRGVFLVCNSIGSCAGLQFAVDRPDLVRGVVILDPSLRMLNVKRQPAFAVPLVSAFQTFLRETPFGRGFFSLVARPETVKNVLKEAYSDPSTVTDALVDCILSPGRTEGAPEVFLDFISYSAGPLPEELLAILSSPEYSLPAGEGDASPRPKVPVLIGWGTNDPWEPYSMAGAYRSFSCVQDLLPLAGVGHCPQDEAPELVNPLVVDFVNGQL